MVNLSPFPVLLLLFWRYLVLFRYVVTRLNKKMFRITSLPLHILESIFNYFVTKTSYERGEHCLFDISEGLPKDILNIRETCRDLCDAVDRSRLNLAFHYCETHHCSREEHFQRRDKILSFVCERTSWRIVQISVKIDYRGCVTEMDKRECPKIFASFFSQFSSLFKLNRVIINWDCSGFYDNSLFDYLDAVLHTFKLNSQSPKIQFDIWYFGGDMQWDRLSGILFSSPF